MSEIEKGKSFQERMKDRIKDSIGELMTDEELKAMVDRTMEEVFFQKRTRKTGMYNSEEIPPLLHEIIQTLLASEVKKACDEYLTEHKDEVLAVIKSTLEVGMGDALIKAFNSQFQSQLLNLQMNLEQSMQNR